MTPEAKAKLVKLFEEFESVESDFVRLHHLACDHPQIMRLVHRLESIEDQIVRVFTLHSNQPENRSIKR